MLVSSLVTITNGTLTVIELQIVTSQKNLKFESNYSLYTKHSFNTRLDLNGLIEIYYDIPFFSMLYFVKY